MVDPVLRVPMNVIYPKPPADISLAQSRSSKTKAVHYMVSGDKHICMQGFKDYLQNTLVNLQASAVKDLYKRTKVVEGWCNLKGYKWGPQENRCFPGLSIYGR